MRLVIDIIFLMLLPLLFNCSSIDDFFLTLTCICLQYLSGRILCISTQKGLLSNTPLLFFFYHEIFIAIGAILLFLFPALLLHTFLDPETLHKRLGAYMLSMSLSIFMTAIGSSSVSSRDKTPSHNQMIDEIKYLPTILIFFSFAYALGILRYLINPDFVNNFKKVLLLELSGSDIRRELTESQFSGGSYFGQGYFNIIIYQIIPILSICAMLLFRHARRHLPQIIVIIATILLLIGEFRRAPLLQYIIALVFTSLFSSRKKSHPIAVYIAGGFLLTASLAIMSFFLGRDNGNIKDLGLNMIYRLFISQSQTGTYIFQMFPNRLDFSLGSIYINNVLDMLPGPSIGFATQLFMLAHDGKMGAASHSAFAEAYANFSFIGPSILGLLLGIWLKTIMNRINSANTSILEKVNLVIITAYIIPAIATGSLIGALVNFVILKSILAAIHHLSPFFQLRNNHAPSVLQPS